MARVHRLMHKERGVGVGVDVGVGVVPGLGGSGQVRGRRIWRVRRARVDKDVWKYEAWEM